MLNMNILIVIFKYVNGYNIIWTKKYEMCVYYYVKIFVRICVGQEREKKRKRAQGSNVMSYDRERFGERKTCVGERLEALKMVAKSWDCLHALP